MTPKPKPLRDFLALLIGGPIGILAMLAFVLVTLVLLAYFSKAATAAISAAWHFLTR